MPLGIWADEEGRGAVEVRQCGNTLCGYVVWVRDSKDRHGCGKQLMGNVQRTGSGWDNGWIVSPDDGTKYSVALEPINRNTVQVIGYMGTRLFSETMTWTRVTGDIERCDRPAASPAPRVIAASVQRKGSTAGATRKAPAVAAAVQRKEPIWTGPRSAPAPHRKPIIVASLEPEIVAPAPILAQRPRRDLLPPAMGLGRSPNAELEQASAENDCGLRAQFFALFGATCKKR